MLEREDAEVAAETIVESLSHRQGVRDWWLSLHDRGLLEHLIVPAWDEAILAEAKGVLRSLRLPSLLLAEELYQLVVRWAFGLLRDVDVAVRVDVESLPVGHLDSLSDQAALRATFAAGLRDLADSIDDGTLDRVPLSSLYENVRWYVAKSVAGDYISTNAPGSIHRRHRRRKHDIRRKASYLYLNLVGDANGRRCSAEKLATRLLDEDPDAYRDHHTALRNVRRWLSYTKRILLLTSPTI